MINNAGKAPREIASQTALVYRRKDGHIVHQHDHVTLEGATIATAAHVEERGLEHAKRRGHLRENLTVLHVKPGLIKEGGHYKVDLKTKKLVELPRPKRPRPQRQASRRARAAR